MLAMSTFSRTGSGLGFRPGPSCFAACAGGPRPLGRAEPQSVAAGEYGYVDARGRLLCRLDVVQADFSKVTADTVNALLIIEGNPAHPPETLRQSVAAA